MTTPTSDEARALGDPTRCYVHGCEKNNEILLHLGQDPMRFADLCWDHAFAAALLSSVVPTCDCPFCIRARRVLFGEPQ